MIEYLALPVLAIGAALVPKRRMKDIDKIKKVFENTGLGIRKEEEIHYPILLKQSHQQTYSTYTFSLPLGLSSNKFEAIIPAIEEGLNKDCDFTFEDGVFKLQAFNSKLPTKWKYTDELLTPGTWQIPIGKNHEGILYHDFEKYPHMLVGGVTRFGKTVFIKEAFYTLLMNQLEHAEFYFLDLKGGLEFGKYIGLPQVKGVASDLLESVELLSVIHQELKDREKLFRQQGYTNIIDSPIQKRTFIIVDEGAELSPNLLTGGLKKYANYCQSTLSEIARIGGGIGYRMLFCTQYPVKEAVPMQIKMNIVARLSFIAAAQVASRVILDENGAEELPSIPGRAIYKIEKKRIVQVPYIDDKYMFTKMEEKEHEIINASKNGKVINDDRPVRDGNNKTSSWNP
ncbi:FtsK/SpoIIIE domain-containing protein [Bacillus massiliigorillae]|uniref:FtsK/SpoIIIE domain-containing protein n=1 Tax=Bacillus massiliigorillae TaxID=1243664 RepID=UPI00039E8999|nr:FtsK/SpoIIIE domain-containing protein [Bacillus massiliigorillae]